MNKLPVELPVKSLHSVSSADNDFLPTFSGSYASPSFLFYFVLLFRLGPSHNEIMKWSSCPLSPTFFFFLRKCF